jgi:hypothetical protein
VSGRGFESRERTAGPNTSVIYDVFPGHPPKARIPSSGRFKSETRNHLKLLFQAVA